ncbi:MAG TPA: hypothetical protein VI299_17240 [Polyangiales bacterium]
MRRVLALALLLWTATGHADHAALSTLEQRIAGLKEENADVRRASVMGLLDTDRSSLGAVQTYLRGLTKQSGLLEKLTTIRSGEAKELSSALLDALTRDRSEAMQEAVTLSALLRALERQHSIDASTVIVNELFAVAPAVFRSEAQRTRKRLGRMLAPGLIQARASDDPALHKLAREGLNALGLSTPQRLYGDASDPELTAAILTAAGDALAADALPWLVAYLDDPRASVRAAARRATAQFEGKAADLLRVRLAELTGQAPDPRWSAAELLSRVTEHDENTRTAPAREALAQAERLLSVRSDLERATQLLDRALSVGVAAADAPRLARAYLALGAQLDQRNQRDSALDAFRRALRSDPRGPHEKQAQARVLYLEAEDRLGEGIADTHALRTAVALDPKQPAAQALAERLERARDGSVFALRRWLGYAAGILLVAAAFLTLRSRKRAIAAS